MLVGNDPASALYVQMKKQTAQELGFALHIKHRCAFQERNKEMNDRRSGEHLGGVQVQITRGENTHFHGSLQKNLSASALIS